MSDRPNIVEGYLGAKPQFSEYGLELDTHKNPDFRVGANHIEIKFKASKPVKLTQQLIQCSTGKDISEYTFCQTMNQLITIHIHMPEEGFYKLHVYALPVGDTGKSFPNIFNYLINCNRENAIAYPFPKQFAEWKSRNCYLLEPMVLHPKSKLKNIEWHVRIPGAKKVALIAGEEWFFLERKGGPVWQKTTNLEHLKGKINKIVLGANFTDDESQFGSLLEYKI